MTGWITTYLLTGVLSMGVSGWKLTQGCTEMNPLMPSTVRTQLLVKGGSIVGVSYMIHFGAKSSPKSAKVLAVFGSAVNTAVAIHDMRVKCR